MNQTPIIVFVCEHGSAKSVVAATYFNQLADKMSLRVRAVARGINPDKELSPTAIIFLSQDHLTPTQAVPQKLTEADLQSAQRIVTFCELPAEYQQQAIVEHWDDIPPVSEDYKTARAAILKHIHYFVKQIKR